MILLNGVNRRAEVRIAAQVDEAIADSPMADSVSYNKINVEARRGSVEITDVAFEQEGVILPADAVDVRLPRSEALALAQNQEDVTLTDVTATIAGIVW